MAPKAKWTTKKRRTIPKAATGAPQTRSSTSRGCVSRASTPSVTSEGRVKQTTVKQRRSAAKKWLSAEEANDLTNRWTTVELRHRRQALAVADALAEANGTYIPSFVHNLRVHTVLQDPCEWVPPLTRTDVLGDSVKGVASALTTAGKLRCLAIDLTLMSEGWLADSVARPTHVMLLEDTASPSRARGFTASPKIFERTTHVVVEPLWNRLQHVMPSLRCLFPKLQYCCIQVAAASESDTDEVIMLIRGLLKSRRLEKLVVCMRVVPGLHRSRDAPAWNALNELSKSEEKFFVLPHSCLCWAEWQAMLADQSTVFNITEDEMREKIRMIGSQDSEWEENDSAPQQQAVPDEVEFDEAVLGFCEDIPAVPRGGTPWTEIARAGFDDLAIPGMPTAEDDLRNMMGVN
ncbi:hypothetical protein DAEQUDRAFT_727064 [Daedalea quercina L-15889]|uniref:Uncharacterized protein n=1 Tax=Daedalea quercina L-15889 TaxID=1314783 RepID=A0A165Q934_9APHY|nr:hypothetical protein DAEQUDRAFT_727064 [Daedalea quercina L-15889]